jgi:GNAT superfamily N-acetyltransferase
MPHDTSPLLSEAEVLALAGAADLPECWRMQVLDGSLRPLVSPGETILVVLGRPTPGALACVATPNRIVWRRVLVIRDDEALLRAERAPFPDGWCKSVIGHVAVSGALARTAETVPTLWTAACWSAHLIVARARNIRRAVRSRTRSRYPFDVRVLGDGDRELFRSFYGAAWGHPETVIELNTDLLNIGLFTAIGELVGSTSLRTMDDRTALSCNTVVAPAWRGRGGSEVMLRRAIDVAHQRGFRRVVGHVRVTNYPSLAACSSVGFVASGRWVAYPGDPFVAAERGLLELVAELTQQQ